MNKTKEIKILYENKEYDLNRWQLERVITLAARRMNHSLLGGQIGLDSFSLLRGSDKSALKIFVNGYESELYKEMGSEIIFAIESGLMDDYKFKKKEPIQEKQEKSRYYVPRVMMLTRIKVSPLTCPS